MMRVLIGGTTVPSPDIFSAIRCQAPSLWICGISDGCPLWQEAVVARDCREATSRMFLIDPTVGVFEDKGQIDGGAIARIKRGMTSQY